MQHTNYIRDGIITAFANTTLFTKNVIFKTLYWFGDKFHTTVSFEDQDTFRIELKPLEGNGMLAEDFPMYLHKLERDLIDFQLREIIAQETSNIKDLLVAKAFSNGELDEEPPGDVTDPVGFNPKIYNI